MSTDPNTKPQPTRLWVRILLVVSLGFNLLIVGAAAGIAIKGGPWKHGGPPGHMADAAVGPLTRALNKEDRRAIGREMRQLGRDEGWTRKAHRASLERMLVLLEATPFDTEAFETELKATVAGLQNRLTYASTALVSHLSNMSDADRAAYAERVKDAMARHKK